MRYKVLRSSGGGRGIYPRSRARRTRSDEKPISPSAGKGISRLCAPGGFLPSVTVTVVVLRRFRMTDFTDYAVNVPQDEIGLSCRKYWQKSCWLLGNVELKPLLYCMR